MKTTVEIKGKLRFYLYLPLFFTILLILFNILLYRHNITDGILFSGLIAVYFVTMQLVGRKSRTQLLNEMINFATRYATVQKQLLNEMEVPYALLDYNARLLWVNDKFTEITGKEKKYHKSITTVFPSLTKELLQKDEDVYAVNLELGEKFYRATMRRIYFDSLTEESEIDRKSVV